MLMIGEILISDDVVNEQFICNLNACKGACCWEGDYGAPLEQEELRTLERIYDDIRPFLSPAGRAVIESEGPHTYYEGDAQEFGTPLIDNGPCAYMTYDEQGVAQCGIERAYKAGATDFKKPISCHLYPIRVVRHEATGMEALNYDRWDICSAACTLGKKHQMPVYQFLKEALIRKYGEDFYHQLDAAAKELPQLKK
ncbi:DUF3109 family protein [Phaeodactylibacter sp.]|uniref:DUF3109 family protein n=1 Tax=Phaeodactylibacter sp. TaxID=1940289 RepID=UPI0025DDFC89|nr:DUF3109 family protein [Phaeodactylibacter sp.]MCI4649603.1 DUF3109 family protein [Phaeodactylibacter sp.]MCI5093103.1 DUF3109 family protein [Phaeodactylibacter sp.]